MRKAVLENVFRRAVERRGLVDHVLARWTSGTGLWRWDEFMSG